MNKAFWAAIAISFILIGGEAIAQTGKTRANTVNDLLANLQMGASYSGMCGDNSLASKIGQSAIELIAFTAEPNQVGPMARKWQDRVDDYRDLQERVLGIKGRPTTESSISLCENLTKRAKSDLLRSDDYLMRLRR